MKRHGIFEVEPQYQFYAAVIVLKMLSSKLCNSVGCKPKASTGSLAACWRRLKLNGWFDNNCARDTNSTARAIDSPPARAKDSFFACRWLCNYDAGSMPLCRLQLTPPSVNGQPASWNRLKGKIITRSGASRSNYGYSDILALQYLVQSRHASFHAHPPASTGSVVIRSIWLW